ncbi:MAG: PDDEXK nuclease domain-containing protein, partial [Bacteroidales bacterium]
IYRMVQFYEAYSVPEFVGFVPPQLQLPENEKDIIVGFEKPQLENENNILSFLCLINWTSHIKILSGCKYPDERAFYIFLCHKEKLLTKELERQIKSGIFERSLIGNNKQSSVLKQNYPTARQYFKDSYIVDFLNLPEVHSEKSLHNGLINQMKDFILELGKDFIFIGEEYRIQVGMRDFRIDLLFFHRGLQCLVAIELKTTEFQPDYIGQLDFYLEALDRDVKKENEHPSIGILLCKSADNEVVEYALSRSLSPTMIAEYKRQLIPKDVLQKHLHEFYDNVSE